MNPFFSYTGRQRFAVLFLVPFLLLSAFVVNGCGGGGNNNDAGCGSTRSVTVNTYDPSNIYIADFQFTQYNSGCSAGYTTLRLRNRSDQPLCVSYRIEFFDGGGTRRWTYENSVNYLNVNNSANVGTVANNSYPIDSGELRVTFLSDPYNACSGGANPLTGRWSGTGRNSGSFNPNIPSRNANIFVTIAGNGNTAIEVRYLTSSGAENGNVESLSGTTDDGAYFQGSGNGPWGSFSSEGYLEDRGNNVRNINLGNFYFSGATRPDETITGTLRYDGRSAPDKTPKALSTPQTPPKTYGGGHR